MIKTLQTCLLAGVLILLPGCGTLLPETAKIVGNVLPEVEASIEAKAEGSGVRLDLNTASLLGLVGGFCLEPDSKIVGLFDKLPLGSGDVILPLLAPVCEPEV